MLYYLLSYVREIYDPPGLGVINYITFRAGAAAVTALIIILVFGPKIIRFLRDKVIEPIKEEAPEEHRKKVNIPTMGGLMIILAIEVSGLLWAKIAEPFVWMVLLAIIWMGAVGFVDDYRKVVLKIKGGLSGRYKIVGQVALGLIIGGYTFFDPTLSVLLSKTTVPFIKEITVDYGIWYIPLAIFIVTAVSNAVNLTDGLDGLAAGSTAISVFSLAGFAYLTGNVKFAEYLNITYIPGAGEVTILSMAIVAACIGFLWFNSNPAEVFMGDTGSLALGSAVAVIALLIKKELLLPLIAGIFFIETLSVIIQRGYFKYTKRRDGEGKRIFRMAPLHHHFQKKGWAEQKIVIRFWIIEVLLVLTSLLTLKLR
ncbi:phospho-N-acetylmuramoyl-pentapeptide-transferase [Chloroherpeton thalassium ATCC 35110]|uniref:Phospho-N-acetylmuramoyl-pentapeptide-transferase n=1 Tax=Chloroherpeton thalassium (strain ATCC 35110 / GB-78) TaxID=517418 RepID=MRAY_CHLT3|nr:phospho-N-acetylmuramoyl-pentapeptide-transferase [Chloroherpeton thalassium]B3QWT4.1 RecName: Full=Phospho-N-acetylmuramoyl-pentapeptide-transferase; AltName: Full=UDP-MurNAc-pentapeptide phosphotransferase [Chloroherpeton thalassium ATCC 35110]ACF13298.1 phospho-N-acetylmuramoyl-pentapeptide-transferase [Chloroherpeton thalassium ATCC 35110]